MLQIFPIFPKFVIREKKPRYTVTYMRWGDLLHNNHPPSNLYHVPHHIAVVRPYHHLHVSNVNYQYTT